MDDDFAAAVERVQQSEDVVFLGQVVTAGFYEHIAQHAPTCDKAGQEFLGEFSGEVGGGIDFGADHATRAAGDEVGDESIVEVGAEFGALAGVEED